MTTSTVVRMVICAVLALPAGWFAGLLADRVPPMGRDLDNNLRDPHALKLLEKPLEVRLRGRYLVIIVALVGMNVATAYRFEDQPFIVTIPYLVWWCAMVALSATDLEHRRLPDRIVLPTFVFGLLLMVAVTVLSQRAVVVRYALVSAGAYFALFLVLNLIHPALAAFGDVKMSAPVGLIVGFTAADAGQAVSLAFWGIFLAFVLAALFGFGAIIAGGLSRARERRVGLGAYFVASSFFVVMFSRALVGA